MKMRSFVVAFLLILPVSTYAINVGDYLIDADIGQYSRSYPGACPKGVGIVAGVGHSKLDHTDYACDIRYYNEALDLGVEVRVTQHAGGDSDKWLLHEVEDAYRDGEMERLGLVTKGVRLRDMSY
jgi:hypothetical protein